MARYLQVAGEANEVAKQLFALVAEDKQQQAAQLIAKLVNYGLRCSPRAVQSTVRLNAVKRAVQGLPVAVGMTKVFDPVTQKSFNAITFGGDQPDTWESADDVI